MLEGWWLSQSGVLRVWNRRWLIFYVLKSMLCQAGTNNTHLEIKNICKLKFRLFSHAHYYFQTQDRKEVNCKSWFLRHKHFGLSNWMCVFLQEWVTLFFEAEWLIKNHKKIGDQFKLSTKIAFRIIYIYQDLLIGGLCFHKVIVPINWGNWFFKISPNNCPSPPR